MAEDAREPSIADLTSPIKLSIPDVGTVLAHELYFKSEVDSLCADMQSRIQKARDAYEKARARSSILEHENKRLADESQQLKAEVEDLRLTVAGLKKIMANPGNSYLELWMLRLIYMLPRFLPLRSGQFIAGSTRIPLFRATTNGRPAGTA